VKKIHIKLHSPPVIESVWDLQIPLESVYEVAGRDLERDFLEMDLHTMQEFSNRELLNANFFPCGE
jgi:hypothetical protein